MNTPALSFQDARRALDAALAHAEQLNVAVAVAVVDNGGNTVALARQDGATFLSGRLAVSKAVTSAGLGFETEGLSQFLSGNPALLAGLSTQPDVAVVPGGVPIVVGGTIVGAIGVAGGQAGEDGPVAKAGLAALTPEVVGA
ncbi:GlcG/HbpS family heme-binding protein [Saccharothrix sp. Mg75]|uniref:GlcG/HbpS family heme-binding protein n=1 Tax=Saccharothrix sp. Mg75 TaxID=3445357 RepID=UPI003EF07C44